MAPSHAPILANREVIVPKSSSPPMLTRALMRKAMALCVNSYRCNAARFGQMNPGLGSIVRRRFWYWANVGKTPKLQTDDVRQTGANPRAGQARALWTRVADGISGCAGDTAAGHVHEKRYDIRLPVARLLLRYSYSSKVLASQARASKGLDEMQSPTKPYSYTCTDFRYSYLVRISAQKLHAMGNEQAGEQIHLP